MGFQNNLHTTASINTSDAVININTIINEENKSPNSEMAWEIYSK